jgi:hypothetical protein
MRAHPGADQRHLADPVVVEKLVVTDLVAQPGERGHGGLAVVSRQREGDVGAAGGCGGDVLHDHVDVDLRGRKCVEDAGCLPDLVGDADDGDLGLAPVVRDAGDDRLLHGDVLVGGVGAAGKAPAGWTGPVRGHPTASMAPSRRLRTHVPVLVEKLDRTWIGTSCRRAYSTHRRCRILAPQAAISSISSADRYGIRRAVARSRIRGEHAVHVGVDLTDVGAQGRRQRHRRGVGAPATERGDVLALLRDALETGHDGDRPLGERALDPSLG